MTELNTLDSTTATPQKPDTWHIEQKGERKGPYSATQVAEMIRSNQLTRDSLCWRPGTPDWTPCPARPSRLTLTVCRRH